MFWLEYTCVDNEGGNSPYFVKKLLKTNDAYIALALALRDVHWTDRNVRKSLAEDPNYAPRFVRELYKGEPMDLPAIEASDGELARADYQPPKWSTEHITLQKKDKLPVTISVNIEDDSEVVLGLVRRAIIKADKEGLEPTKADLAMAKRLEKLLPPHEIEID